MQANELPETVEPESGYMTVGTRYLDNAWGSEAEWNKYDKVIRVVYRHDNPHGERVFVVIGDDIPGGYEWVRESNLMFIDGGDDE